MSVARAGRFGDGLGGGEIVETSGDCHTVTYFDAFGCLRRSFPTLPLQRETHK